MLETKLTLENGLDRLRDGAGGRLSVLRRVIDPSHPAALATFAHDANVEGIIRDGLAVPADTFGSWMMSGPKRGVQDDPAWKRVMPFATGLRQQILAAVPGLRSSSGPLYAAVAPDGVWEVVLNQISYGVLKDVEKLLLRVWYNANGSLWIFERTHSSTRAVDLKDRLEDAQGRPFSERLRWDGGLSLRGRGFAMLANPDAPNTSGYMSWHVNFEELPEGGLRTLLLFLRQTEPLPVTELLAPRRPVRKVEMSEMDEAAYAFIGTLMMMYRVLTDLAPEEAYIPYDIFEDIPDELGDQSRIFERAKWVHKRLKAIQFKLGLPFTVFEGELIAEYFERARGLGLEP